MKRLLPPTLLDLLLPVFVIFAAFAAADALHACGAIRSVSRELIAAIAGVVIAWAVAVVANELAEGGGSH